MTNRERFLRVLNFEKPDRMPIIEWASWWDKTTDNWFDQGLPKMNQVELYHHFGLDDHRQFGVQTVTSDEVIESLVDEQDYERMLPLMYPEHVIDHLGPMLQQVKPQHDKGDIVVWMTLAGFFWFPRTLWGIQRHLFSFYDHPQLYHRICNDLVEHYIRTINDFCTVLKPDFMTFAEDMSYNNGPMLSKQHFDEFIKPYYQRVIPVLKQNGIKVIVDTDGNVMPMVQWLLDSGVDGILPLERQSMVDAQLLREQYPKLLMIGHFDKRVMKHGEAAMRAEFERLLPTMKKGGFIASVDHQTPPDVSVENYRIYMQLYREYAEKAVN